jgi:hypothetical protein
MYETCGQPVLIRVPRAYPKGWRGLLTRLFAPTQRIGGVYLP